MIVVATPTRNTVNAGFAYDLAQLIRYTSDSLFTISQGSILSNLRTLLAKTAIKNGASHVLFIDSDMRFPSDTIAQLLQHDLDIVGANCRQRVQEQSTARKNGEFVDSIDKSGIEQVDSVGMGVTLINKRVFSRLPEPWFATPWDGSKHVGEDVFFCELAKQHGFKIWIDHDLSQKVKHVGTKEF